jgi:hypothetical protein
VPQLSTSCTTLHALLQPRTTSAVHRAELAELGVVDEGDDGEEGDLEEMVGPTAGESGKFVRAEV